MHAEPQQAADAPELLFPYMVWAKEEGFHSPYCLSQSGMPVPDAALLAPAPDADPAAERAADLAHPLSDAAPRLEARLAELFGVEPARVIVTVGASAAMQLAALRWFRAGARVVTEVPSYDPFRALPVLHGADARVLERRLQDGWRLDPEAAEDALAGRPPGAPGHVFLASPNNPTGATLTRAELARLAASAERAGGVLVSSEVYMEFAAPGERVHAFELAPNGVSIGSLTKAYGLGALRVGWMVLGPGLASERRTLLDLLNLGYVDPPTPSLRLALRALDRLPELIAPYRRLVRESRPLLWRWMRETPGVRGTEAPLGLTVFPRIEGVADTRALSAHLAREHGVDAVPGEFFGLAGHLRLGFGVPAATLEAGLARLTAGIEAFRRGA